MVGNGVECYEKKWYSQKTKDVDTVADGWRGLGILQAICGWLQKQGGKEKAKAACEVVL